MPFVICITVFGGSLFPSMVGSAPQACILIKSAELEVNRDTVRPRMRRTLHTLSPSLLSPVSINYGMFRRFCTSWRPSAVKSGRAASGRSLSAQYSSPLCFPSLNSARTRYSFRLSRISSIPSISVNFRQFLPGKMTAVGSSHGSVGWISFGKDAGKDGSGKFCSAPGVEESLQF